MGFAKVVRLAFAIVIAVVILLPLLPTGRAPPLVPYEAWGIARDSSGGSLGINQPIRTFIDGVDYSNLTSTYRADGSYQTQVLGNWYIGPTSETPAIKEGGDPNDPIMFAHGDMTGSGNVFQETAVFTPATFQNRDLTEAAAANQPALIKIQTVTTRPADALSQYAYLCNPTSNPVDLSKYYFEKDVPGSFAGPRVSLTGIVGAGQKIFGDFLSTSYLATTGDAVKLVFDTAPGAGAPNGGADIVVDRVEFNASAGGSLYWEPGNTLMTDALAPGIGQEIHRNVSCTDTNQGSDFTTGMETGRPTAPTVLVFTPNGGERWTGGSTHSITFNLADAQDPNTALVVNITYSTNSGATWPNLIASGISGTVNPNTRNWVLPNLDTSTARVLVCARDTTGLLGCDSSDNDFTIDDTFPSVIARTPTPGQTGVPVNDPVVVTFSEGMDQSSTEGAFTWNGPTPSFSWVGNTMTVSHSTPFAGGQSISITIGTGARDLSDPGKNLIPAVSWSFTTFFNNAPSVSVTTPFGGECWSGGSGHNIQWTMSDPETPSSNLVAYLNYTSGAGNGVITGPLVGQTSFAWTPSGLNAMDVQIVVTVIDSDGGSRSAASNQIEVDSTAPTMTSVPANGAASVARNAPVTITFSEAMDRPSVQAAFSWSASATPTFNWVGNQLTVTHTTPFPAGQVTVTIAAGGHDDCAPGLPLAPTSFSFTTVANQNPTAALTAPSAGTQFSPGAAISITWTMSDQETADADLVVYLNYTSSAGNGAIVRLDNGEKSYTWTAPGIDSSDVRIVLTVIDQDGVSATDNRQIAIRSGGLDVVVIGGLLGIILAVVIALLLWFLVFAKRRKKEEGELAPPPAAPMRAAPVRAPPRAPAPPRPAAPPPPSGGTRECPSCGTIVDTKDTECFMCGHKF